MARDYLIRSVPPKFTLVRIAMNLCSVMYEEKSVKNEGMVFRVIPEMNGVDVGEVRKRHRKVIFPCAKYVCSKYNPVSAEVTTSSTTVASITNSNDGGVDALS